MRIINILLIMVFAGIISACRHTAIGTVTSTTQYQVATPIQQIQKLPLLLPPDSAEEVYSGLQQATAVINFYRSKNFKLAWLENDSLPFVADSMMQMIKSVRFYGLQPVDYHLGEIERNRSLHEDSSALKRVEVLLTDAFLTIAVHLKYGKLKRVKADSLQVMLLFEALKDGNVRKVLESQEPGFAGYGMLKVALKEILGTIEIAEKDSVNRMDPAVLRRRIQTIEINMERWRWEKELLGNDYVWINIPSYRLQVIENNDSVMESKVIVGTEETPTPELSSHIQCFTIYPYWHVPRKIAVEEYLPRMQQDTSFITSNNFEILDRKGNIQRLADIDWEKYNKDFFPFTMRQREGPENALGVIKFVFDNPYAVFLHDTNAKRLFNREIRALSHGCIRMEKAYEFAHYLVKNYSVKYTSKILDNYLELKQRRTIDLSRPLPIYIRYFTCAYSDKGLEFYEDIYHLDKALMKAFYRPLLDYL